MKDSQADRRAFPRTAAKATVSVVRQSDLTRNSLKGFLEEASSAGVRFRLPVPLGVDEFVSLTVSSDLERTKMQLRGRVTRVEAMDDGDYQVGCALLQRLNYHELQQVRRLMP